ncbi:putative ACT domain-containing protein ACR3 [Iris pallida]|uniref:ACT domain-containing protein ACR3 n=1 Tax=Iris pallida TaxID=29817 RepID=A0AAX6EHN3_IRIPA|nr:putative ACT domain-containing protein ACR3 [Iris pallida]
MRGGTRFNCRGWRGLERRLPRCGCQQLRAGDGCACGQMQDSVASTTGRWTRDSTGGAWFGVDRPLRRRRRAGLLGDGSRRWMVFAVGADTMAGYDTESRLFRLSWRTDAMVTTSDLTLRIRGRGNGQRCSSYSPRQLVMITVVWSRWLRQQGVVERSSTETLRSGSDLQKCTIVVRKRLLVKHRSNFRSLIGKFGAIEALVFLTPLA